MKNSRLYLFTLITLFIFWGCKDNISTPHAGLDIVTNEKTTLNPSGYAPLTATIDLTTDIPVSVNLRIVGKHGTDSDVIHDFKAINKNHQLPVLGLYANFNNTVELTFYDSKGSDIGTQTYHIQTNPLINDLPTITINQADRSQMAPGMTLVSYFGYAGNSEPQRPFMFDKYGDIRWYLDYSTSPILNKLFYDVGVERLKNGDLYFGDISSDKIYEVDMLGRVIDSWPLGNYQFHHQVLEMPNGNFLVCASVKGAATDEDHVIEIDRYLKNVVHDWDLKKSLDYNRKSLTEDRTDWIHINAVQYDSTDNTIIVSGRTQGVVKLTMDNKVVWILGPHFGWGLSGDGVDLNSFLLHPLHSDGQAITDSSVIKGFTNASDFEWNWYQHAVKLLPDGHIMMFDNGDNRNYSGSVQYSRAVEFAIDKKNMTVKQVWSYGKQRGAETYSRIVSDVDYLPKENHVIWSPGAVYFGGKNYGKVIELDYNTKSVIFEATITPPIAYFGITFHRTERLSLYP